MSTKTVLSIKAPTPRWATITFRITIAVTTAIAMFIMGTQLVPQSAKAEILLALKSLDFIVWAASKAIGIVPADEQPEVK